MKNFPRQMWIHGRKRPEENLDEDLVVIKTFLESLLTLYCVFNNFQFLY